MIRHRAKQHLPTVMLTLISIIQALALEVFWNRFMEAGFLWRPHPFQIAGWLQAAVVLLTIVTLWVYYVNMVLRFTWVPDIVDSVAPFIIGIGEFALIESMGPDSVLAWYLIAASMYLLVTYFSGLTFQKARREPENRWFFTGTGKVYALYGPQFVAAGLTLTFAALTLIVGIDSVAAIICCLLLVGLSVVQLIMQERYWRIALRMSDEHAAAPAEQGDDG